MPLMLFLIFLWLILFIFVCGRNNQEHIDILAIVGFVLGVSAIVIAVVPTIKQIF